MSVRLADHARWRRRAWAASCALPWSLEIASHSKACAAVTRCGELPSCQRLAAQSQRAACCMTARAKGGWPGLDDVWAPNRCEPLGAPPCAAKRVRTAGSRTLRPESYLRALGAAGAGCTLAARACERGSMVNPLAKPAALHPLQRGAMKEDSSMSVCCARGGHARVPACCQCCRSVLRMLRMSTVESGVLTRSQAQG